MSLPDQDLNEVSMLYITFKMLGTHPGAFSESLYRMLLLDLHISSICRWQMVLAYSQVLSNAPGVWQCLIISAIWMTPVCSHEFLITLMKPHIFSLLLFLIIRNLLHHSLNALTDIHLLCFSGMGVEAMFFLKYRGKIPWRCKGNNMRYQLTKVN